MVMGGRVSRDRASSGAAPVMTVKEARERLGEKYQKLNDEQVEYIVVLLSRIAKVTIEEERLKLKSQVY